MRQPWGSDVSLYTLDGKTVYNSAAKVETVTIPVATSGVYILSVDGKSKKVNVK